MLVPARARLLLVAIASLGAFAAGCGLFEELPPVPTPVAPIDENRIVNGGFEAGAEPWRTLESPSWRPFDISDTVARSGDRSLALTLQGDESETGTRIVGAVQEVRSFGFPEFVSGYYRVDEWQPTASFQYLQFVVIVRGGQFGDAFQLHEIRFPIAGAARQPFELSNSRFVFLSRDPPETGEWTYFSYPLARAFERHWGHVPQTWDSLEVLFEVRYDGKTAEQSPTRAQVYFDDLYLGPQLLNPNRPDQAAAPDARLPDS
jgi:hypothetical protein